MTQYSTRRAMNSVVMRLRYWWHRLINHPDWQHVKHSMALRRKPDGRYVAAQKRLSEKWGLTRWCFRHFPPKRKTPNYEWYVYVCCTCWPKSRCCS